jgi:hypothetical protein
MGNGVALSAAYNARQEVTSLAYGPAAAPLWSKQYTWTPNGNLELAADMVAGSTRQYGYDTLNRLILAQDIAGTQSSSGETTGISDGFDSNILQDSQALGTAGWSGANVTMTPNARPAPDGSLTAGSIVATSGSTNSWVKDYALNPALYDSQVVAGSVWLRVPIGTLTINVYIFDVSGSTTNTVANTAVTLSPTWQQFQFSGLCDNGLTSLQLEIGGLGSGASPITSGQEVDVWGPQLQVAPTLGNTVTNYMPYSQKYNTLSWSVPNQAVAPGTNGYATVAAPDGTNTAFEIQANAGASNTYVTDSVPNPSQYSGEAATGSVYLRAPSGTPTVAVSILNNGPLGLQTIQTTSIQLSSTWQRVQLGSGANLQPGSTSLQLQIGGPLSGSSTWTNGQAIDIWGAQMEATGYMCPGGCSGPPLSYLLFNAGP